MNGEYWYVPYRPLELSTQGKEKEFACYRVMSSDVIRAYDTSPKWNADVSYYDFYINKHYVYETGSEFFEKGSTLPWCLQSYEKTHDPFYRQDIADILVIFVVLAIVSFYLPWRLLMRMFRRWR